MEPEVSEINFERRTFMKSLPVHLLDNARNALAKVVELRRIVRPEEIQTDLTLPRMARINVARCLAWGNSLCQACYLACPLRDSAIEIRDQKPIINISKCDGCGFCMTACGTVNDQVAIELIKGGE